MTDGVPTFRPAAAGDPRPPRSFTPVAPAAAGAPEEGAALRVVARLASPLAGDPTHLDALLVYVASRLAGKSPGAEPGYKVDRKYPCPDTDRIPIGMARLRVAGRAVARCTSPVLAVPTSDGTEYVCKRLGVEYAGLAAPGERKVVTTTNEWAKSYRLPLRVRTAAAVAWLCVGDRRAVRKLLKHVLGVGKKVADGYGRVASWEVERLGPVPGPWWPWWLPSAAGPVLMRPLPADWARLPAGLVGARADFGACTDPYWHPDRYGEVLTPC